MIHSAIGLVHLTTAVTTLLIGLLIFLRPKGGRLHKFLGYVYSVSMLTMLVTEAGKGAGKGVRNRINECHCLTSG